PPPRGPAQASGHARFGGGHGSDLRETPGNVRPVPSTIRALPRHDGCLVSQRRVLAESARVDAPRPPPRSDAIPSVALVVRERNGAGWARDVSGRTPRARRSIPAIAR